MHIRKCVNLLKTLLVECFSININLRTNNFDNHLGLSQNNRYELNPKKHFGLIIMNWIRN